MQTTPPIANEQQLWKILEASYEVPVDDTNHQTWMYPLSINSDEAREAFESDLENTFLHHSKGGRNKTHTENLRRHWRVVLLNLASAVFQKRWLLVPTDNNYYSPGNFWPERLGMKKDGVSAMSSACTGNTSIHMNSSVRGRRRLILPSRFF